MRRSLASFLGCFSRAIDGAEATCAIKCSVPTAQRDINELLGRGILRRNPGGSKNTSYELAVL